MIAVLLRYTPPDGPMRISGKHVRQAVVVLESLDVAPPGWTIVARLDQGDVLVQDVVVSAHGPELDPSLPRLSDRKSVV